MKLGRVLCSIAVCSTMIIGMSLNVHADELVKGARWSYCDVCNNQPRCLLDVNTDYMKGAWAAPRVKTLAFTRWVATSNVRVRDTAYSAAKVRLQTYNNANSKWPYGSAAALTCLVNGNGKVFTTTPSASVFGKKITAATILFNPAYSNKGSDYEMPMRKVVVHELGHVMNLAHPSADRYSVMRGGILPWNDYDKPRAFDITCIRQMYK